MTDLVLVESDGLDLEVDPDGGGLLGVEGVVREPEEQRGLAHPGLPDDEQLQRGQQRVGVLHAQLMKGSNRSSVEFVSPTLRN